MSEFVAGVAEYVRLKSDFLIEADEYLDWLATSDAKRIKPPIDQQLYQ